MTFPWSNRLLSLHRSAAGLAASYLEALLPAAQALGLQVEPLLADAGLSPAQLQRQGQRLPLFKAFDLLLRAEQQSGDPLIGLRLGLAVRPRAFQLLGYAALSSATLGDAIGQLQRLETLVWDIGRTELREEAGEAVLSWRPGALPWVPRQAVEIALSGWVSLGRRLSEGHAEPLRIEFQHALADAPQRYAQLFGCAVRGSAGRNALIFPRALLQLPLPTADPVLCLWMQRQAQAELAQDGLTAGPLRVALCEALPLGEVQQQIAERLGLSERQLKRRLADAGLSFAVLQDEVRQDLARLYLQHSDRSLGEIAYQLGFAEQSCFSRAFRRWQGCAPGDYRRQQRALAG
ncbi:MAG: AraC family transcriptional regulator [Pseudomonas sp.]|uniref:AraC family transcriptional regulator n=1 Tax=Pseudomonas sp. TaxID=306 RepID=UPI00339A6C65